MSKSIVRNRPLTADEAAKYREIRKLVERDKPEILARYQAAAEGPRNWDEVAELHALIGSLRASREQRGLSRDEAARLAGVVPARIEDLEEFRDFNPPLALLSRYAVAVGHHLVSVPEEMVS